MPKPLVTYAESVAPPLGAQNAQVKHANLLILEAMQRLQGAKKARRKLGKELARNALGPASAKMRLNEGGEYRWSCHPSPTGLCFYDVDSDDEGCLFCGKPDERL